MKTVIVTGTPGTGKTALSKKLAKKLNYIHIDVDKLISKHRLHEGYDRKRRTKIVDTRKLNRFLIEYIKKFNENTLLSNYEKKYNGIIIDSHISHHFPKKYIDLCIVLKCSIKDLNKRLKRKNFHKQKIQENLQAEIFDVCLNEAKEQKHKVVVVDTTKGFNINILTRKIGG